MIDSSEIYSGSKYLDNLNIIYNSFNIAIFPRPDVNFQHHGINLSIINPAHGRVQKPKKADSRFFTKVMQDTIEKIRFNTNIKT